MSRDVAEVDVRSADEDTASALVLTGDRLQVYAAQGANEESGRRQLVGMVTAALSYPSIPDRELKAYVTRCLSGLDMGSTDISEQLAMAAAKQIREKVSGYLEEHRAKVLADLIDLGEVEGGAPYRLPLELRGPAEDVAVAKSLYTKEPPMDGEEGDFALKLASAPEVLWHKIREKSAAEFQINGFRNHYPDFMIRTTGGYTFMAEYKGRMLKQDEGTLAKVKVGRLWSQAAGPKYQYRMVFADGTQNLPEGALTVSGFSHYLGRLGAK